VDIALPAGFRGARLQRATRLLDIRVAVASLMYSRKQCALNGRILSCATRRTEVHRSTLKRAPRGTRGAGDTG
jgi:hypothetical protein